MKTFILAITATMGLSLAGATGQADAHWGYRNCRNWDSSRHCYVTVSERCWVSDCCDSDCCTSSCDTTCYSYNCYRDRCCDYRCGHRFSHDNHRR
jgi:hypothetical protein